LSDFALRFGLALVVVTVASAAVILSRRNYAKSANLERNISDAEAAHMAGTQILDVRLARLEEHADASPIQDLDARLARLEEHTDATAIHNLDDRLAKLEEHTHAARIQDLDSRLAKLKEHTDATTTQIGATQKQTLEENERT
jgi:outer membrane murein-binding lipoprotein Lpp